MGLYIQILTFNEDKIQYVIVGSGYADALHHAIGVRVDVTRVWRTAG
jgi:hypothetical protein